MDCREAKVVENGLKARLSTLRVLGEIDVQRHAKLT
jgi:hypothetical protein